MKKIIILGLSLVTLCLSAFGQTKQERMKELLNSVGTFDNTEQMLNATIDEYKTLMPSLSDEILQKAKTKLNTIYLPELVDSIITTLTTYVEEEDLDQVRTIMDADFCKRLGQAELQYLKEKGKDAANGILDETDKLETYMSEADKAKMKELENSAFTKKIRQHEEEIQQKITKIASGIGIRLSMDIMKEITNSTDSK